MAFTPNFSYSQSAGDLTTITFTDTSTDFSGVSVRFLYIVKYDGNNLLPEGTTTTYVVWPVVDGTGDTINVSIADKDYCLDVTVVYYNGSTVNTSKNKLCLVTGYGDFRLRQLTQAFAANRAIISDKNMWVNKNKLRTLLDDAAQAVSLLNDQTIAQFCLDEAKPLTDNISMFF